MCDPVTSAFVGTAIMGNQSRIANERALNESKQQAETQAKRSEDLLNADARKARDPNAADVLYGKMNKDASGSTTLTSPQGVSASSLTLGKSSLLGA